MAIFGELVPTEVFQLTVSIGVTFLVQNLQSVRVRVPGTFLHNIYTKLGLGLEFFRKLKFSTPSLDIKNIFSKLLTT